MNASFLNTTPLVHEPGEILSDEELEAASAAGSHIVAAASATEIGADDPQEDAGAFVVPAAVFACVAAVAFAWHLFSRFFA